MTHAIPVPLPSALIDHHAVDVERKYTDGWGVKVDAVATAPSGEIYALYSVHRHTYGVGPRSGFTASHEPDHATSAPSALRLQRVMREDVRQAVNT